MNYFNMADERRLLLFIIDSFILNNNLNNSDKMSIENLARGIKYLNIHFDKILYNLQY